MVEALRADGSLEPMARISIPTCGETLCLLKTPNACDIRALKKLEGAKGANCHPNKRPEICEQPILSIERQPCAEAGSIYVGITSLSLTAPSELSPVLVRRLLTTDPHPSAPAYFHRLA